MTFEEQIAEKALSNLLPMSVRLQIVKSVLRGLQEAQQGGSEPAKPHHYASHHPHEGHPETHPSEPPLHMVTGAPRQTQQARRERVRKATEEALADAQQDTAAEALADAERWLRFAAMRVMQTADHEAVQKAQRRARQALAKLAGR